MTNESNGLGYLGDFDDFDAPSDQFVAQATTSQPPLLPPPPPPPAPAFVPERRPVQVAAPREEGSPIAPFAGTAPLAPAPSSFGAPVVSDSHAAGLSLLLVTAGTVAGTLVARHQGGSMGFGGLAGSTFGGALANFLRAWSHWRIGSPQGDREAAISGLYGVAAAVIGGVVWWQLVMGEGTRATANPDDEDDDEHEEEHEPEPAPRGCSIRRAGP